MQGVLQGNGMGPFIWCLISSVLMSCMHTMGYMARLVGCISGLTLTFMGYGYVDDTDVCFTGQDNDTSAATLLGLFQKAVDCWEVSLS